MQLRNRSTWIAVSLVTLMALLGISSVQASSPYFYRSTALTSATTTCTETEPSIHWVGASGQILFEENIPANGRVVSNVFVNGTLVNYSDFPGPQSDSSTYDYTLTHGGEVASYPLHIEYLNVVEVDGHPVYFSSESFTCTGDGTFPVTFTNLDLTGGSGSAISDGRINPQNYAPVALYCDGSVLTAYGIDSAGQGTKAWDFDFKDVSADAPKIDQNGIILAKTPDGRYDVLAPQHDGKQYLFVFGGCPATGATETYVSDPATGQMVRTD